jgi:hypothetical protein
MCKTQGQSLLGIVLGDFLIKTKPNMVHKCNRLRDFEEIIPVWLFDFTGCATF